MKIHSIEIKNFRSIKNQTVRCTQFNTFVGPNGSGKSTVLNALNVFFGEINTFSEDDFHKRNTNLPISIKVTFHDLSNAAEEEFNHYVRAGLLVVQCEISLDADGTFKKTIRGERFVFEPFIKFFDARSAKERGEIFKQLSTEYEKIDNATNDEGRRSSLTAYEESLPDKKKRLQPSGEEFFGVSKGTHKFQRHVCWVYVPAVKDAGTESEEAKSSHLGKLIQHTIRSGMDYDLELEKIRDTALSSYSTLLDNQQSHLNNLQERLAQRLQTVVMTDANLSLDWKKDEKSVSVQAPIAHVQLSERGHVDKVEKFGHGLQRSFLLIILQELLSADDSVSPTLLLGCEEPELYQHPPQARHLAEVLMELSGRDAQVMITTHSPYFIDVDHYEGIKMFRNGSGSANIASSTLSGILNSYNAVFTNTLQNQDQARTKLALQTQPKFNELFFTEKVVLVEGISDQAYLQAYLRLSGKRRDFQKSGSSILVCEGKSSLALMILIAKGFSIPFHVIFDCDSGIEAKYHENPQKFQRQRDENIRDNDAILKLAGHKKLEGFPDDHIFRNNLTGWHLDIENTIEQELGEEGEGFRQAGRDAVGNLGNSKKQPLYIAATMTAAWDAGKKFPIIEKIVDTILEGPNSKTGSSPT